MSTEVGLISIKAGAQSVTVDEAKLEAWVRDRVPGGMETVIDPSALTDPEVIEMISACFPALSRAGVRPTVRGPRVKEMVAAGGKGANAETGEFASLGEVEQHKPTGAFSYRPAPGARDRIVSQWLAGRLTEIAFSPLMLPAGPQAPREPEQEQEPDMLPGFGPFGDDLGLYDPVSAAQYAIVMSGGAGFTTPPIEAYRMIRDGGVMRERALAWLAEAGLDPADPREGKDTLWPLPSPEAVPGE